uniref:Lipocalin/cytosolic fatty-acid binding domain-containing protein n=1 Tax=Amblyomma maculatum TaxID=34609 RepID=G3MQF2_AMBMU
MKFILTLSLSLLGVAAAAFSWGIDTHTNDLDIRELANVNGPIRVLKRKHHTSTQLRCLSATKVLKYAETRYQYRLRARLPSGDYDEENVYVTLFSFPEKPSIYKSIYTSGRTGLTVELTLKAVNDERSCFVVFVQNSDRNNGCELLMQASKYTGIIPLDCARYYETQCHGESVDLYVNSCE